MVPVESVVLIDVVLMSVVLGDVVVGDVVLGDVALGELVIPAVAEAETPVPLAFCVVLEGPPVPAESPRVLPLASVSEFPNTGFSRTHPGTATATANARPPSPISRPTQ